MIRRKILAIGKVGGVFLVLRESARAGGLGETIPTWVVASSRTFVDRAKAVDFAKASLMGGSQDYLSILTVTPERVAVDLSVGGYFADMGENAKAITRT